MKRYIVIICICVLVIMMNISIVMANSTYTIELEVTKNTENKSFTLYMLLPQDYIEYAINKAGLDIEYTGAETLKQYDIPLINIDKEKIQDETYSENGIEYVQILLEQNEDSMYIFEIIEDYPDMDMKLRVKNNEKDYIMHIDNFKIKDDVCQIEYNYDKNEIKQPTKITINFATLLLMIILVFIMVIGINTKKKGRNE